MRSAFVGLLASVVLAFSALASAPASAGCYGECNGYQEYGGGYERPYGYYGYRPHGYRYYRYRPYGFGAPDWYDGWSYRWYRYPWR